MREVIVQLGERSYPVNIGENALESIRSMIPLGDDVPIIVITDVNVREKTRPVYGPLFEGGDSKYVFLTVPASETSKSIGVFTDLITRICRETRKYRPFIVALGGGVVGDLAGFVAATYRRGVGLIQVPTTLLAQVDSSIGGKVGIDIPEAKNMIGAFYQPSGVVIDLDFLDTLQEKQISSGLAEVIKYSIISDRALFDYLEDNMQNIRDLDKKCLEKVVSDCVAIKARTVAEDEYDVKDVRIILNFGHTLGHAVETASEYSGQYDHGEAVGIGMVMASDIAVKMGILEEKHSERIRCLIRKAGLPLSVKNVDPEDVLRIFQYDKKFVSGSMRFVLPERIGKVRVTDNVPFDLIERTVREYVS